MEQSISRKLSTLTSVDDYLPRLLVPALEPAIIAPSVVRRQTNAREVDVSQRHLFRLRYLVRVP